MVFGGDVCCGNTVALAQRHITSSLLFSAVVMLCHPYWSGAIHTLSDRWHLIPRGSQLSVVSVFDEDTVFYHAVCGATVLSATDHLVDFLF